MERKKQLEMTMFVYLKTLLLVIQRIKNHLTNSSNMSSLPRTAPAATPSSGGCRGRPPRIVFVVIVPEHAPTADRATGRRCIAPSGRSAAAFGLRAAAPTRALQLRRPFGRGVAARSLLRRRRVDLVRVDIVHVDTIRRAHT